MNGKIVAKGSNHDRSAHKGKLCSSTHAEIQAIENWKRLNKGKNERSLKKIAKRSVIYVVRKSRGSKFCGHSKPCINCAKEIKRWSFKKVVYSCGGGKFKSVDTRKIEIDEITTHLSKAQINAGKHIPEWKKI